MSESNELLGFPPDARLLIINADDFGMYQGINEAIDHAFSEGIVRSRTFMTPCPGASEASDMLKADPDIPFGVHLTLVCEMATTRWGPLSPQEKVLSLVDEDGMFFSYDRIPELLAGANVEEVEIEFRAQIDSVVSDGLRPTHLDWHCLRNGGRTDIYDLTLRLAKEYHLALRTHGGGETADLNRQGLPANDHELLDSFSIPTTDKPDRYFTLLRELPAGLTEWAIHPGLGDETSQQFDPAGWQVRKADFDFAMSPRANETIEREGIVLLDYRPLQAVGRADDTSV